jgi:hypothetical protein
MHVRVGARSTFTYPDPFRGRVSGQLATGRRPSHSETSVSPWAPLRPTGKTSAPGQRCRLLNRRCWMCARERVDPANPFTGPSFEPARSNRRSRLVERVRLSLETFGTSPASALTASVGNGSAVIRLALGVLMTSFLRVRAGRAPPAAAPCAVGRDRIWCAADRWPRGPESACRPLPGLRERLSSQARHLRETRRTAERREIASATRGAHGARRSPRGGSPLRCCGGSASGDHRRRG